MIQGQSNNRTPNRRRKHRPVQWRTARGASKHGSARRTSSRTGHAPEKFGPYGAACVPARERARQMRSRAHSSADARGGARARGGAVLGSLPGPGDARGGGGGLGAYGRGRGAERAPASPRPASSRVPSARDAAGGGRGLECIQIFGYPNFRASGFEASSSCGGRRRWRLGCGVSLGLPYRTAGDHTRGLLADVLSSLLAGLGCVTAPVAGAHCARLGWGSRDSVCATRDRHSGRPHPHP